METSDLEIVQTQLKFTLWFIGVLMTVLSFFVVRAFKAQEKKDESQDEQLTMFGTLMKSLNDAIQSIDKSTAINTEILRQHEKHLEQHDKVLEKLAGATKTRR